MPLIPVTTSTPVDFEPFIRPAPVEQSLEDSAPESVDALESFLAALPSLNDPARLSEWAAALPREVGALPPDVSLVLVKIAAALVAYAPAVPVDLDTLPAALRIQWIRVGLAASTLAPDTLDPLDLLRTVQGWSVQTVTDAGPLLTTLAASDDVRLRQVGFDWLAPAVQQLALSPAAAFELGLGFTRDPTPAIRAQALRALAKPWLLPPTPAATKARKERMEETLLANDSESASSRSTSRSTGAESASSRSTGAAVFQSAVELAVALDDGEVLRRALHNDALSVARRSDVLGSLGTVATPADIDAVLAFAELDPLASGAGARAFFLQAHRHGIFVQATHLEALLSLFDRHSKWTGAEFVRVTHVVRNALLEILATVDANDSRWNRRADILSASVHPQAPVLLKRLLDEVKDIALASRFVEVASRCPEFEGDAELLRWLDSLPEVTIAALRTKGGPDSVAPLLAIACSPVTEPARRVLAEHTLNALVDDPFLAAREMATHLGPKRSGLLTNVALKARENSVASLVDRAPWPDTPDNKIDALSELKVYCETSDLRLLPDVTRLFRAVFQNYVRKALAGDFTIKRRLMPDLEQLVFRYGRNLIASGRCVRTFVDDMPETGRDLVMRVALDWLREDPAPETSVALLELIGRHQPAGPEVLFVTPYWRHRHRGVQRAAIEALLSAGEGARGLELSICRLADDTAAPVMVQALEAIARLDAEWAEPVARKALGHPEMGVKKAAAEALGAVGNSASVDALVHWLSAHDNPGFRSSLKTALDHAAGSSAVAVLIHALGDEELGRRQSLLHDALSSRLSLAATLRLARITSPAHDALVDACVDGDVCLRDASAFTLAAALHRQRRREPADAIEDPTRRLRICGFTEESALELVALPRTVEDDRKVLAVVRAGLGDWLQWISTAGANAPAAASALVFDAVTAEHPGLVDAVFRRAASRPHEVEPDRVVAFIERCIVPTSTTRTAATDSRNQRIRAAALVRALASSPRLGGLRRYRALKSLGVLVTRADIGACLEHARHGTDVTAETIEILADALRFPVEGEPSDSASSTDTNRRLREESQAFFHLGEAERQQWLDAVFDERPLGLALLPAVPSTEAKRKRTKKKEAERHTVQHREALLADLNSKDEHTRVMAAVDLLNWPDAHATWPAVLDLFLAGQVELGWSEQSILASQLNAWPTEATARANALRLVPSLAPHQRRRLTPQWLSAWDRGELDADKPLRCLHAVEDLLPLVSSRAAEGEFSLLNLLPTLERRTVVQALIESVGEDERTVAELTAQLPPEDANETEATDDDETEPLDPIAGKSVRELDALISEKDVAHGLAVRAVHAMATHGDVSLDALERLTLDRRPPIRSAALRAFRRTGPRERSLEVSARVLREETRIDVVISLMKSLGHGRHAPTLGAVLDRVTHGTLRVRDHAHEALVAWGPDVVPQVRRAMAKTRPDKRPLFQSILDALEG